MEELLKVIAESIYLSNSENYLIAIASTNVKIIDLNDSSYQIIKLKDVQSVCMSDDDKYLFLCKYYSGTVYCYDIKEKAIINKRQLGKNIEILFIQQMYPGELFIGVRSTKEYIIHKELYKHTHFIFRYNYENNTLNKVIVPNHMSLDSDNILMLDNEIFVRCCQLNCKHKMFKFDNGDFVLTPNILGIKLKKVQEIQISKSQKYISLKYSSPSHIQVINVDTHENEIETSVIKKKPINLLEMHNLTRGQFAINNKAEDIYYMVHGNCIDIFNLCTKEMNTIEMNNLPMKVLISIKKNIICSVAYNTPMRCYCYIYKF